MPKYQCCLCKEGIDPGDALGFDPCALIIVASWAKQQTEQRMQQFFCHFECFRRAVGASDLYITDPDFEPNVE